MTKKDDSWIGDTVDLRPKRTTKHRIKKTSQSPNTKNETGRSNDSQPSQSTPKDESVRITNPISCVPDVPGDEHSIEDYAMKAEETQKIANHFFEKFLSALILKEEENTVVDECGNIIGIMDHHHAVTEGDKTTQEKTPN